MLTFALCALFAVSSAQFNFSNTHGNGMVLQQGPSLSIVWGYGTAGALVTVSLEPSVGAPSNCVVGTDNIWSCAFGPVQASFTSYTVNAVSQGQTITLTDVLFGDVWICSGQSNMQFNLIMGFNATEEIAAAGNFPYIRLFTSMQYASMTPLNELAVVEEGWSVPSNVTVGGQEWSYFSAVCWFYGRDIYQNLGYPIGLIATDYGGTYDEAWSSPDALAKCPHSPSQREAIENTPAFPVESDVGAQPNPNTFSVLWNAMIVPFLRYPIYGAIWYQGESDAMAPNDVEYACTFPAMISDWRAKWFEYTGGLTNPVFPFGFVVLSTWSDTDNVTCGNNAVDTCPVAITRWGQLGGYGYVPNAIMPNTFMASAVDLGDPASPAGDIHPRYKQQVGARLANAGLAVAYDHPNLYWSGPIAQSAVSNGNSITVTFASTGADGLFIKNQNYVHFEVGTASNIWTAVPIASFTADTVTVTFAGTASQIRYNWYQAPCEPAVGPFLCAVYSQKELLPANPFFLNVTTTSF